jgi:hypothetical protein
LLASSIRDCRWRMCQTACVDRESSALAGERC